MKILLSRIKAQIKRFFSDLKYDRELNRAYKKANRRIKEAQGLCVAKNSVVYVLPDPKVKGDFFCISAKERKHLVKKGVLDSKFDGYFCIENSIFIARPSGAHSKKNFKIRKEWLIEK